MRNPYIVGRWLYGNDHYGRQRVLDYLIHSQDPATWVVGTRRMGKTSLLRQLEWLTDRPDSPLVPLFWDLQGCETPEDLDYELFISIEDQASRFKPLGVDVAAMENVDTIRILRSLQRTLRAQDKRLFLLIDETEALINVGARDSQFLARLRKTLQNGNHRTVMMATKALMRLNDMSSDWNTSPFLFGVNLVNLWSLDADASRDLILQKQGPYQMDVSEKLIEDILLHTHRHPYLLQFLCSRLFDSVSDAGGTLRVPTEDDLRPDHLLSGFFQIDFDHLTALERQILLAVARHGIVGEDQLVEELNHEDPNRIATFAYGMNKLGYLRSVFGQWTLGNEFLRRWVGENYATLASSVQSQVSDHGVESLLIAGRRMERNYLQQEMQTLQEKLDSAIAQRNAYDGMVPAPLLAEIQRLRREIQTLTDQLHQLEQLPTPTVPTGSPGV